MEAMITGNDLSRLSVEAMTPPREWTEKNGIEMEAMQELANDAVTQIILETARAVNEERDFREPMTEAVCNLFRLGWEAHKEYGRGEA